MDLAHGLIIMTVRIRIKPGSHVFEAYPHETLLEAALRSGLAPFYRCGDGTCGQCKARILEGRPGAVRAHDFPLTASEQANGSVLLCCTETGTDMVIETALDEQADNLAAQARPARVEAVEKLTGDVMRLVVRTGRTHPFRYLAGQHASLEFPGIAPRNKSMARCPGDDTHLEFHVRRTPGDPFAQYVFDRVRPGTELSVRGAWGQFTFQEAARRPVLFLAYETGFAPINSLIEYCLHTRFPHPLHLYWVVHDLDGHYLDDYCRSLAETSDNFHYSSLVMPGMSGEWSVAEAAMLWAVRRALSELSEIAGFEVYATGPARNMRAAAALLRARGLPAEQLHIDGLERFEDPRAQASAG